MHKNFKDYSSENYLSITKSIKIMIMEKNYELETFFSYLFINKMQAFFESLKKCLDLKYIQIII